MKITVKVSGEGQKTMNIMVPCGPGTQTLKWLALVASQRHELAPTRARTAPSKMPRRNVLTPRRRFGVGPTGRSPRRRRGRIAAPPRGDVPALRRNFEAGGPGAQAKPNGRTRTREDHADRRQGFFLPADVSGADGSLAPDLIIRDVVADGGTLSVKLMTKVEVDDIGAPIQTPWQLQAFTNGSEASRRRAAGIASRAAIARHEADIREEVQRRVEEDERRVRPRPLLRLSRGSAGIVERPPSLTIRRLVARPRTGRGAAAAASWIARGRVGWIVRGRVAAPPRAPRGSSVNGSRRRRGRELDRLWTGRLDRPWTGRLDRPWTGRGGAAAAG